MKMSGGGIAHRASLTTKAPDLGNEIHGSEGSSSP
jgi:hypothetical protein